MPGLPAILVLSVFFFLTHFFLPFFNLLILGADEPCKKSKTKNQLNASPWRNAVAVETNERMQEQILMEEKPTVLYLKNYFVLHCLGCLKSSDSGCYCTRTESKELYNEWAKLSYCTKHAKLLSTLMWDICYSCIKNMNAQKAFLLFSYLDSKSNFTFLMQNR